jgi:hypothetical protein
MELLITLARKIWISRKFFVSLRVAGWERYRVKREGVHAEIRRCGNGNKRKLKINEIFLGYMDFFSYISTVIECEC